MRRPALKGLYVISDERLTPSARLLNCIWQAIQGGSRWVQYRDKTADHARRRSEARALVELCHHHGVGCLINDDVDLTLASGADGVHVGAEDLDILTARARLGPHAIIGASCYDQIELAKSALQKGADYVAFGSLFPSPTKPNAPLASLAMLRIARQELAAPICAIGGITTANAASVINAGADLLAVVSGVFAQPTIKASARAFSRIIDA